MRTATARAHPNIAFIKYWGNADDALRLPANPSISMNLDGLHTTTTVTWDESFTEDTLILNGNQETGAALERVTQHLDHVRKRLEQPTFASIQSENNFPTGAGIASSASAFAALTVAAFAAAAADISERELTTFARLGSGSASRSVPSGFVEWHAAATHEASYAESIAAPDHWDLVDVVAIISTEHKRTTSQAGHPTAKTSDLQPARVAGAADRLQAVKQAILERDFATFAQVVELDSNLMHSVMMTSQPALFYWQPASLRVMETIRSLRADGLRVCYTLDAGPNVHCICVRDDAQRVRDAVASVSDILDVRVATVGQGAKLIKHDA